MLKDIKKRELETKLQALLDDMHNTKEQAIKIKEKYASLA